MGALSYALKDALRALSHWLGVIGRIIFISCFLYSLGNLARAKTTSQSSIYQIYGANRAVDGSFDTNLWHGSCTHTNADPNAWWRVDLGGVYTIGTVKITNRAIAWERLSNFDVKVGSSLGSSSM